MGIASTMGSVMVRSRTAATPTIYSAAVSASRPVMPRLLAAPYNQNLRQFPTIRQLCTTNSASPSSFQTVVVISSPVRSVMVRSRSASRPTIFSAAVSASAPTMFRPLTAIYREMLTPNPVFEHAAQSMTTSSEMLTGQSTSTAAPALDNISVNLPTMRSAIVRSQSVATPPMYSAAVSALRPIMPQQLAAPNNEGLRQFPAMRQLCTDTGAGSSDQPETELTRLRKEVRELQNFTQQLLQLFVNCKKKTEKEVEQIRKDVEKLMLKRKKEEEEKKKKHK